MFPPICPEPTIRTLPPAGKKGFPLQSLTQPNAAPPAPNAAPNAAPTPPPQPNRRNTLQLSAPNVPQRRPNAAPPTQPQEHPSTVRP
ncbi:MAG: hypothetical protein LBQ31_02485 [Bacteroidales bacterium]|nr:hypothetical protein [Bacteroidales bacterium]